MSNSRRFDLRHGVTETVVLMISRHQIEEHDIRTLWDALKVLLATRQGTRLHFGNMALRAYDYYFNRCRSVEALRR
jgi:hypothetical protein